MAMPRRGSVLVSLALLGGLASPAFAATHWVDDDRRQCPDAAHTAIQAALDAAAAGDTVQVCAGLYPETVRVLKTVLLHGPRRGSDGRKRRLGGANEAVVRSTRPFAIEAPSVAIDGFTLAVQLDEEGEGFGVVVTPAGSGYRIQNNLIDASSAPGIELVGVAGELAHIRRNQLRGPIGIRAEHGSSANLIISDNLFVNASIRLSDAGHDAIHILRNTLRHVASGVAACDASPALACRPEIRLIGTRGILVQQNSIAGSGERAIYLADNERPRVVDNRLRAGTGIGIEIRGITASGTSVLGNRLAGFGGAAMLINASGVLAEGNEIEDSEAGIVMVNASANRIAANNIEDHASYGIDVSGDPTLAGGNDIADNEVRGNAVLDCRDRTTGSGSFGTANTWTGNEGSRSSPAGLCTDG